MLWVTIAAALLCFVIAAAAEKPPNVLRRSAFVTTGLAPRFLLGLS
jgi:hypothetical protein